MNFLTFGLTDVMVVDNMDVKRDVDDVTLAGTERVRVSQVTNSENE